MCQTACPEAVGTRTVAEGRGDSTSVWVAPSSGLKADGVEEGQELDSKRIAVFLSDGSGDLPEKWADTLSSALTQNCVIGCLSSEASSLLS